MRLWLDDERQMPDDYDIQTRFVSIAMELINKGIITHISFDHDLGYNYTGYTLAKHIEKMAENKELKRLSWQVHSANPVGRRNIEMAMISAERFWDRNEKDYKMS